VKYIKRLNIDFNDWEEVNYEMYINDVLSNVFNKLKVNDKINVSFTKEKRYKKEWGIIKFKSNDSMCVEFDNNISGHDGNDKCSGKSKHCWYFGLSAQYRIYIHKLIR